MFLVSRTPLHNILKYVSFIFHISEARKPSTKQYSNKRNFVEVFDYWPQRSCGQGYVFTRVCHSVNRGDLPQFMLGYHPPRKEPPRKQTPLEADTPQEADTPPKQTPPWEGGTHLRNRHPLGSRHPPGKQTPRAYGQ